MASKKTKTKPSEQFIIAIAVAIIGLCGTVIAAFIGYLGIKFQTEMPIIATQTAQSISSATIQAESTATLDVTTTSTAAQPTEINSIETGGISEPSRWIENIPKAGTQLDFTLHLPAFQTINDLRISPSPYGGIYLSYFGIYTPITSWAAKYKDGERLPAQSQKCYINQGYPEAWQAPLNLTANDTFGFVGIFVDSRYSMIVKSIEVIVTKYEEPKASTEVDHIEVGTPGAGGASMGFTPVRTDRVFINKDTSTIYQIEFQDFILKPQEAVELVIPVTFSTDGYFQLQFKTYGQAIPIYEGDGEGDFTLTSGRDTYGWLNIEEPLDYRVTTESHDYEGAIENPYSEVDLVPCP